MRKRTLIVLSVLVVGVLALALAVAFGPQPASAAPARVSSSQVYWTWDLGNPSAEPVGTSTLVRTDQGVSADLSTSGLLPGHTMTLWFVVFNYPELCSDGRCGPDDMSPAPARGDILFASGHVVDADGRATFGGHLKVGDASGSGRAEIACPETRDCTPGLLNPKNALIVLAVHSHGPALQGQELKAQISSFTGGCIFPDTFLGPFGIADGPEDVPVEPHYCSTIQQAPHAP